MNVSELLKEQGYDLITGPIRNQELLQLWIKKTFDDVQLYHSHIDNLFESTVKLHVHKNSALSISSVDKDEYDFDFGITLMENILASLNMRDFDLKNKIKSGKKVTVSYEKAKSQEVPIGEIDNYLIHAKFKSTHDSILKEANRNNLYLITGILLAKNPSFVIETDNSYDNALVANLNDVAEGKAQFIKENEHDISLTTTSKKYFPIAVKVNCLNFDNDQFDKTKLVSDNKNLF